MMRILEKTSSVFLLILLASSVRGQSRLPAKLQNVSFEQRLNTQVPLNVALRDEGNRSVRLGDYVNGEKPVILVLAYYRCPRLCNVLLNQLTETLRELAMNEGFRVGKQFRVLTVSIDPRETSELATAKKLPISTSMTFPMRARTGGS